MLSTEKISNAFSAIVQEAEKVKGENGLSESARAAIDTIVSIAKHQSDIRQAKPGTCKAHGK
jgi:hypothetical protein